MDLVKSDWACGGSDEGGCHSLGTVPFYTREFSPEFLWSSDQVCEWKGRWVNWSRVGGFPGRFIQETKITRWLIKSLQVESSKIQGQVSVLREGVSLVSFTLLVFQFSPFPYSQTICLAMDLDSICLVPSVPFLCTASFTIYLRHYLMPRNPATWRWLVPARPLGPDPCMPLHSTAGGPSVHTLGPVFASWLLLEGAVSPLQMGYSPASMFQGQDVFWELKKKGLESTTLIFILLKYVTWTWQKEEKLPLKQLVPCFLRLKRWLHMIRS